MSLSAVILAMPLWLQEDGAKLFFLAACGLALLLLLRHLAGRQDQDQSFTSQAALPEQTTPDRADSSSADAGTEQVLDPEEHEELPPMRDVSFTLRSFEIANIELETGPDDPETFCEDAAVSINYRGGVMAWEFTIATPKGLEARLAEREEFALHLKEAIVVTHYDLELIKAAVMKEIKVQLDSVPEEVSGDEMKEAAHGE